MDRTWRTTASTSVLRDRWINVRADDCVTPGGVQVKPYYVLHYPNWVHVLAITPDDRVVLVRQYRHAVGSTDLEMPGGAIDAADASPEAAARRELLEETGYTARHWQPISALYANPATHTNRMHAFLALGAEPSGGQSLDAGEDGLTIELLPVADVLAGVSAGLLTQSMQVSTVLLGLAIAGRLSLQLTAPPAAGG